MRNVGLDEAQAGIKIAGRNINNLRYADDTTLMAESEEELKSLLMKVKEKSEETGSAPITSWHIDGETMETVTDYLTCLLRNLHAGQEATVRTGHGTTDWFQIGKGVRQGCILSPCLFRVCNEKRWAG